MKLRVRRVLVFAICFLMLAALLFLRAEQTQNASRSRSDETSVEKPSVPEQSPEGSGDVSSDISLSPAVFTVPSVAASPSLASENPNGYTQETWQLVSDLVTVYRNRLEGGEAEIDALLEALQEKDPGLGTLWSRIMEYWRRLNAIDGADLGSLSKAAPTDDSLCIVVLGFQLLRDGGMAPELEGRCETALQLLAQYPDAWLAVTGGGTASGDRSATEADVMADWFIARGVSPARILIENCSFTTVENARNTCRLLAEGYPEISTLLVVSSDYHVKLGMLLFQSASYLYSWETGADIPYTVAGSTAFPTSGNASYESVVMQAQDLWALTDPHIS